MKSVTTLLKWQKLSDVSQQKFEKSSNEFVARSDIVQFIRGIDKKVCEKLEKRKTLICKFGFDEEQEKEMETEIEQEYHIERPVPAGPKIPTCHDLLENYLLHGQDVSVKCMLNAKVIIPIRESLDNTKFYEPFKNERDGWSPNIFVSKDFKRVLDIKSNCDEFLRPVWWIGGVEVAIN